MSVLAGPMLAGHNQGVAIFWVIAAGLAGLALYRWGEVRGAWGRWRTAVDVLRARRAEALKHAGQAALLVAMGLVALILASRS